MMAMAMENVSVKFLPHALIPACWTPQPWVLAGAMLLLAGCGSVQPGPAVNASPSHLTQLPSVPAPARADAAIPALADPDALPPAPQARSKSETYTVVVNRVPVADLLFALARDAKIDVDIKPGLAGPVSLNAINQTLPQIMARLAEQVDMRYEWVGRRLVVGPDSQYAVSYKVDYVNISRAQSAKIGLKQGVKSETYANNVENASESSVTSSSSNDFWTSLSSNIQGIIDMELNDAEKQRRQQENRQFQVQLVQASGNPTASGGGTVVNNGNSISEALKSVSQNSNVSSNVVVNRETGTVTVYATSRQHRSIQSFIDRVTQVGHRQVLIEATIAEVQLNDQYQTGVDWSRLAQGYGGVIDFKFNSSPFFPGQAVSGLSPTAINDPYNAPAGVFRWTNTDSAWGNISAALMMLSTFGDARVLSSPKVLALNNQPAVLKVTEDLNYFVSESGQIMLKTTPVGITLSVTPMVGDDTQVSMLVRPTITRLKGYIEDPSLRGNRIPELYVRELETIMRVGNGQVAVLGGLMEDGQSEARNGLPWISKIPFLSDLTSHKANQSRKTELVVLLRPVVIRGAEDFRAAREAMGGEIMQRERLPEVKSEPYVRREGSAP